MITQERFFLHIISKPTHHLRELIQRKIRNKFIWFAEGLSVISEYRSILPFFSFSIIIWLLEGFLIFLLLKSFYVAVPLITAYLLMIAIGLAIALPSAPGYLGVYQFVCLKVLSI
jgi:uncharacterized protein (TIRG00374 family)